MATKTLSGLNLDKTRLQLLALDNMVWPILLATFIGFTALLPEIFATFRNVEYLLYSSASLGLITLAVALTLISGHFDLSVGSITGFSAVFTAMVLTNWFPGTPGIVGILIILIVGTTIGLGNGVAVAIFGVNPFLQTLAFLLVFRSAVTVMTTTSITGLPSSYMFLGSEDVFGIPVAIFVVLIVILLTWFGLNYTRTGLELFAIGGNKAAAEEAGINTRRLVLFVYGLSGFYCALAGLILTGFLGAATTTLADGTVFPAFAAAVIGGISLYGGRGNVMNAFGGVLLLAIVQTGLVMLRVPAEVVNLVNGVVLLIAIFLFTFGERYRDRILSS